MAVVNAMGVPTSGSNSLTISAHFMFTELEFYAPHVDPTWVVQSGFVAESFVEGAKGFVTNVFDRVTSGIKTTVSDAYDLIGSTKVQMFDFIDSGRAYLRSLTGLQILVYFGNYGSKLKRRMGKRGGFTHHLGK